jgi:hypothetical protein
MKLEDIKSLVGKFFTFCKEHKTEIAYVTATLAAGAAAKSLDVKNARTLSFSGTDIMRALGSDPSAASVIEIMENRAKEAFFDSDKESYCRKIADVAQRNPEAKLEAIRAMDRISAGMNFNSSKRTVTGMIEKLV